MGEALEEGVARELLEECGLEVRVLELIEVFDRIYFDNGENVAGRREKPRFHYVIADFLCERTGGVPVAGSDVTEVAFASEDELAKYHLTEAATRIVRKAFAMNSARRAAR